MTSQAEAIEPGRGPRGRLAAATPHRSPWLSFIARRLLGLVVVLIALAIMTFLMVRLVPGDPAALIAGTGADGEAVERVRHDLGIDKPIREQFVSYASGLIHGDLGQSFLSRQPVTDVISSNIGSSLKLAAASVALVLLLSVPIGMAAAAFTREGRHRHGEVVFTGVTSVFGSLPEYLIATFLAYLFAVELRLLPVAGDEGWQSLVLPAMAISLHPIAVLSRLTRVETLNVFSTDYMRTARSKRLPARLIYLRHALPNVVTASLTIGGIIFAQLIGSAVVVENVFARPGFGTALVRAVFARDYPTIQGIMLFLGIAVVLVNAIVDILLAMVDPRSMTRHA